MESVLRVYRSYIIWGKCFLNQIKAVFATEVQNKVMVKICDQMENQIKRSTRCSIKLYWKAYPFHGYSHSISHLDLQMPAATWDTHTHAAPQVHAPAHTQGDMQTEILLLLDIRVNISVHLHLACLQLNYKTLTPPWYGSTWSMWN